MWQGKLSKRLCWPPTSAMATLSVKVGCLFGGWLGNIAGLTPRIPALDKCLTVTSAFLCQRGLSVPPPLLDNTQENLGREVVAPALRHRIEKLFHVADMACHHWSQKGVPMDGVGSLMRPSLKGKVRRGEPSRDCNCKALPLAEAACCPP